MEQTVSELEREKDVTVFDCFQEAKAQTDDEGYVTAGLVGVDTKVSEDPVNIRMNYYFELPNMRIFKVKGRRYYGCPKKTGIEKAVIGNDELNLRFSDGRVKIKEAGDRKYSYKPAQSPQVGFSDGAQEVFEVVSNSEGIGGILTTISVNPEPIETNKGVFVEVTAEPYLDISISWRFELPLSIDIENPNSDLERLLHDNGVELLEHLDGTEVCIDSARRCIDDKESECGEWALIIPDSEENEGLFSRILSKFS